MSISILQAFSSLSFSKALQFVFRVPDRAQEHRVDLLLAENNQVQALKRHVLNDFSNKAVPLFLCIPFGSFSKVTSLWSIKYEIIVLIILGQTTTSSNTYRACKFCPRKNYNKLYSNPTLQPQKNTKLYLSLCKIILYSFKVKHFQGFTRYRIIQKSMIK